MTGAKFFYDDMVACGLKSSETLKVTPAFQQLSSYVNKSSTGQVQGVSELNSEAQKKLIEGKHVLVIEDIIDSGRTMIALLEALQNLKAASV